MTYALRLIVSVVVLGMATAAGAQSQFRVVDPAGSIGTEVHGIDDLGVFVGNFYTRSSSPTTSPQHAFHGLGNQIVNDDVSQALNSLAQGISNPSTNGTIRGVGLFQDRSFVTHGVLIVAAGTSVQERVIDVPGSVFTSANAVNANGLIVGKVGFGSDQGRGFAGFPPYGTGNFSVFDAPGAIITEPLGIRDDGTCVGVFTTVVAGVRISQGFSITLPGGAIAVHRLPPGFTLPSIQGGRMVGSVTADGRVTALTGIANNGVVVGIFSGTDGVDHGLIFFPPGVSAFGFTGPSPAGGVAAFDFPNSFFTDIFGISPAGTTIVGSFGSPSDGLTHGFIAR